MSGWATDIQLAELAVSSGLCKVAPDMTGAMASAVAQFEEATGWYPFLAAGVVSLRHSPPDDGYLWLSTGFVRIDEVRTGYSDSSEGTVLTLDTDYQLLPDGFADKRQCCDRIRMPGMTGGAARSVLVTGLAGRCEEGSLVFRDANHWVMRGALASMSLELQKQEGPLKRLKQGPVDLEFGLEGGESRRDLWVKGYEAVVRRYGRVIV